MAALSNLIAKPKFFKRKPGYENATFLCDKCRGHQIIVGAKWGCDYFMFTNVLAKKKSDVLDVNLHFWCEVDPTPKCLRAFEEVELV